MPYIHIKCEGEIGLWSRKCHKCKKVWPLKALFVYPPPKDMVYHKKERKLPNWALSKSKTSYAKWADSAPPGVAEFASRLPNWPRWARVLSVIVLALVLAIIVVLIRS